MRSWWSKFGRFTRDLGGEGGHAAPDRAGELHHGGGEGERRDSFRAGRSRGVMPSLGLVLICLAVYLPGLFSIPPIDRDESRFAQASRQMFESGDYVVPRVQDRPRLNKPPLIYWLQCGSVRVFGDPPVADDAHSDGWSGSGPYLANIWVFRVPSVLCAIGAVLVTFRLGARMFDARAAWLGAAFLGMCPMVAWDAHQARADQLLLFCTTCCMACLFSVWRKLVRVRSALLAGPLNPPALALACPVKRGTLWSVLGFWIALGAGVLAKGPITPLVALLTILALGLSMGRWRWVWGLRPILGAGVLLVMVAPWVMLVGAQVGWSTYIETIYNETIGRSGTPAEGHWGPPGYHLVLLVVLMWPGSLLTGLAIRHAWTRSRLGTPWKRDASGERLHGRVRPGSWLFLLAWVIPSWLVFELVSTKLPHYTMPLYPALCLLSARAAYAAAGRIRQAGAGVRAPSLDGLNDRMTKLGIVVWSLFALPLSLPTCLRVWWGVRRGHYLHALTLAIVGMVLSMAVLFEFVLPQVLNGSVRINEARRELDDNEWRGHEHRPFASVGYHEDSLVFLTRGTLSKINANDLPDWTARHPGGLVVLDHARHLDPARSFEDYGLKPIDGSQLPSLLNYSNGQRLNMMFFRSLERDASGSPAGDSAEGAR